MFTLFINDLPDGISSYCKKIADDTKLYDLTSNCLYLQSDIDRLQQWSDNWNLYFNADKCKIMHLGKTNPKFEYVMRLKNDELVVINKCTDEKDLGVIFDYKLSFDTHIQHAINRANRMLGIIRRTFTFLNKITLLNLYKALVRPHLEYGNEIWFPLLKMQSAAIEKVQRRTTKLLREVCTLNYKDRMVSLALPSLKYHRLRGDIIDIITVYKLLNGLVEVDWQTFFTLSKSD